MAPRCLYLLPDLPARLPSQFTKVSIAAISPSFLASLHFCQSLRAEAARAWMSEAFRAVKPDGRILRWTLQPIDKCSEGLFHKDRGRALRVEKESRQRQRKISSVNQAWLRVSFLCDWWQVCTGGPLPPTWLPCTHLHAACRSLSVRVNVFLKLFLKKVKGPSPKSLLSLKI